jgi:hypothetical protein
MCTIIYRKWLVDFVIMWLPRTHLEFYQAITLSIYTPAMPNKTARKELSSEIIVVILALHKLGYSASRIKEEGLTEDIPKSTITF